MDSSCVERLSLLLLELQSAPSGDILLQKSQSTLETELAKNNFYHLHEKKLYILTLLI